MSAPELFHRCAKHEAIAPHNNNAPGQAECGACIMREVAYLHDVVVLDLLDTMAVLFHHHCRLRRRVSELEGQLLILRGPIHES